MGGARLCGQCARRGRSAPDERARREFHPRKYALDSGRRHALPRRGGGGTAAATRSRRAEEAFPDLAGKNVTEPDFQTVHDARMLVYSSAPATTSSFPSALPPRSSRRTSFCIWRRTSRWRHTPPSRAAPAFPLTTIMNRTRRSGTASPPCRSSASRCSPIPTSTSCPLWRCIRSCCAAASRRGSPTANPGYEFLTNAWTAQGLNDQIIAYWTENNSSNFNTACAQAGIR